MRMGETQAVAAVTLLVGHPGHATPNRGEIDVALNLSPLCGPKYNIAGGRMTSGETAEAGGGGGGGGVSGVGGEDTTTGTMNATAAPADPLAIESYVRRTLRTSGIIDPKDLCIEVGKSAWKVRISIVILNHDGNIEDVALLSAVAALADTALPRTIIDDAGDGTVRIVSSGNEENASENGTKLQIHNIPVPLTIGVFDGKLLVDPCGMEEEVLQGTVTVVINARKENEILSLNKTGFVLLSPEDMAACVHMGFGRAKEMESILIPDQK